MIPDEQNPIFPELPQCDHSKELVLQIPPDLENHASTWESSVMMKQTLLIFF